jgi:hypothetical protein
MEDRDNPLNRLEDAAARTEIIKAPSQYLHTFGITKLHYYLVTEPSYLELVKGPAEAVVREGDVTASMPVVVTPTYMTHLDGFGEEAYQYFEELKRSYGPNTPGLLYRYSNQLGGTEIVEGTALDVAQRISERTREQGETLSVVIKGVDDLWDVSLLKFIYDYTMASISSNVAALTRGGLLSTSEVNGVPTGALKLIETLFYDVKKGGDPGLLKRELDRWELYDVFEDKFLDLFRK